MKNLAAVVTAVAQTRVALAARPAQTTRRVLVAETRTVAVVATARTSQLHTKLLARRPRVQPLRPRVTVAASTSAQQHRALEAALALVVATTLHSLQKLENPDQWSGFFYMELLAHQPTDQNEDPKRY
jgi:hypothetical protein